MISECSECRDTQVEDTIFQVSANTEVHLWQTTTENRLVVSVDLTVAIDITIVAVTHLCTWLILVEALALGNSVQLVELSLCTDDTLIIPAIELTYFLTDLCNI